MRKFIISIARSIPAAVMAAALAGAAAAQDTSRKCTHEAWILNKDPKGLNVRAEPGLKGKIVGNLKYDGGDDNEIVTVTIVGYRNGWIEISGASTVGGDELYRGRGWVSARYVMVYTESRDSRIKKIPVFAGPSESSRRIGTVPDEEPVRVAGTSCFGLKIVHKDKTGWISREDFCGNPVTTCP